MPLLLRDLIKDTPLVKESRKRYIRNFKKKEEKPQYPAVFEPMTSRVLLRRRVLFRSPYIAGLLLRPVTVSHYKKSLHKGLRIN